MHPFPTQSVEMLPSSQDNKGALKAKGKPTRATSLLRLSQGLQTGSHASLHSDPSAGELPKGMLTTSLSPRHKKGIDPVARQQYDILNEVRKQRAALRLHDIQVQRSHIIDGIRSRALDFGDGTDLTRSQKGIHRRN